MQMLCKATAEFQEASGLTATDHWKQQSRLGVGNIRELARPQVRAVPSGTQRMVNECQLCALLRRQDARHNGPDSGPLLLHAWTAAAEGACGLLRPLSLLLHDADLPEGAIAF
jgi:hypothetical protein